MSWLGNAAPANVSSAKASSTISPATPSPRIQVNPQQMMQAIGLFSQLLTAQAQVGAARPPVAGAPQLVGTVQRTSTPGSDAPTAPTAPNSLPMSVDMTPIAPPSKKGLCLDCKAHKVSFPSARRCGGCCHYSECVEHRAEVALGNKMKETHQCPGGCECTDLATCPTANTCVFARCEL